MRQETQNRALHQDITFSVIMITFNKLRKFEIVCFLQQSQLFASVRISSWEVLCKKKVLINFAKFTVKHLCWIIFFNKAADVMTATLLKRDFAAAAFLLNLRNF